MPHMPQSANNCFAVMRICMRTSRQRCMSQLADPTEGLMVRCTIAAGLSMTSDALSNTDAPTYGMIVSLLVATN
jgi:hypothetical protein